jgi:hypothetical protein
MAFVTIHRDTSLSVADELEPSVETPRNSLKWYDNATVYAPHGQKLRIGHPIVKQPTFIARLLSGFRTKRVMVPLSYHPDGSFTVAELKASIVVCLDHDDDILTQFQEYNAIRTRLNNDQTFEDVVATLKWMHDDPDIA